MAGLIFSQKYRFTLLRNGSVPEKEQLLATTHPPSKKSSYCHSDRLTVSTVAATVTVAAAVTVIVSAAVPATAMSAQIYREKKMIGAAATSPPTAGEGTCLAIPEERNGGVPRQTPEK